MADKVKVCSIYRTLLRTIGHSVRFHKQEVKNLRRSFRDDFNQTVQTNPSLVDLEKKASQTMLFHLSSYNGRPSREPNDERRQERCSTFPHRQAIAARVMSNVSSLTYHHLSPNTVMQSKGRTALGGGSDSRYMRQIRSKRDLKRRAKDRISAQGYGEGLSPDQMEVGDMGANMITSLFVPHRRQRGPLPGPPDARQFIAKEWNGQKPNGNMRQTEHALLSTRKSIDQLRNKYDKLKQIADASGKGHDQEEAEKALKNWRSQRKNFSSEEKKFELTKELQAIRSDAASLLYSVVQKAELSTGACLGSARIGKLARGEWLTP
ncbi:uncharacterized protein FA14DRAFT_172019 [Meira miltonrushii]|uniref:Uncharacterized protein n=1 Tax=Meira miltonrushii TaxID=1280837 RepID=A0A316VHA3_9BASI|nr:uncharacterized protein FA14DRAFT_172019 [Meira miltonrushii]PWN35371.1 hypothetical protein FA14DRAFT_172019 [Meira miltonrushii]